MNNSKLHIIKEIAQQLDCGLDCYYDIATEEIIAIPGSAFLFDSDFQETFKEELAQVKKHKERFIKFEALEGFESFKIMERFVEQLSDKQLQYQLEHILANKKPFQKFNNKIDQSDFRQDWFNFKQQELESIVQNHMTTESNNKLK